MCPRCGSLVGVGATHCHQCGASVNYSMAAASKSLSRFLPQTSPATYFIVALCGLLYALSYVLTIRTGTAPPSGSLFDLGGIGAPVLERLGASFPLVIDLQQPWRLITAVFLHASLLHIGFNLWVLMDIGPVIEEMYGSARYFFVFVVTGAFGYVASSAFGHFSIGASGGLLGLIGLLLAVTTKRSSAGLLMLRKQLIWWLVYIARRRIRRGIPARKNLERSQTGRAIRGAARASHGMDCWHRRGGKLRAHAAGLFSRSITRSTNSLRARRSDGGHSPRCNGIRKKPLARRRRRAKTAARLPAISIA
jgi:rhomboid protease GluP